MPDDILKNLLPTPPPAAGDSFADQPTAEERRALGVMYDPAPEPLAPGEFYSTQEMLRSCFDRNFLKLSDGGVLTLEQQAAERKEFAGLVRETGLGLAAAELLHDRWTSARLEGARAGGDNARELATQIDLDAEASRVALRETWGAKDAADLVQRAKKFATQHPKLNAILNTGGIGSRVDVVQAIVEHVRNINFR
jgi:hypothetical protein